MKQLIQNSRNGKFSLEDVPSPMCLPEGVLVSTSVSVISAGTEKTSVNTAKASLLGKARQRPDLVRQVLRQIQKSGLRETYQLVQDRLNQPLTLGYSCAGTIVEAGALAEGFAAGDRVACTGAGYASHAEVNYVPGLMAVRIPETVSNEQAAYSSIGAIALQGIRQAGMTAGESVGVIGLGMVGQLTVQLALGAGCRVVAFDISQAAVDLVSASCSDRGEVEALLSTDDTVIEKVAHFTRGRGLDRVIITAGTSSNAPMILAGDLLRDRGTLIVVGAVPVDLPRSPFYEKEIDVRFSRSTGPGRYDPWYEEHAVDYPVGYVRWTQQRNMEAFLDLIAAGRVDPSAVTTHRFAIEQAEDAYGLITAGEQFYSGVCLTYSDSGSVPSLPRKVIPLNADRCGVSVIGLGKFVQTFLMPTVKSQSRVELRHVINANGVSASTAAERNGFADFGTDPQTVFDDEGTSLVMIGSRHDSHAEYVVRSLRAGKHVYVEKPVAINPAQLEEVVDGLKDNESARLFVGYNRRFSPSGRMLADELADRAGPMSIHYRVSAGKIPRDHWIQDPLVGGGRLVGEACHFVDFILYLTGAGIRSVVAASLEFSRDDIPDQDATHATFALSDGSVATLQYLCNGDDAVSKETVEVFCDEKTWFLDDFRTLTRFGGRKSQSLLKSATTDKGHKREIDMMFSALSTGAEFVSHQDIIHGMEVIFALEQSLRKGEKIFLEGGL